jgi:hypothetical protein
MGKMASSTKITGGACLVLLLAGLAGPAFAAQSAPSRMILAGDAFQAAPNASEGPAPLYSSAPAGPPRPANFLVTIASDDARRMADWVLASDDNGSLPFVIIDKVSAKVFVFDKAGQLRGASMALLGLTRGDDSVPGIGSRRLSTIGPSERTTPAGRFVAALGNDFSHDVLWIDYGSSISMHRVIIGNPGDHRLQRLSTSSVDDKRITYGCVNVPVKFYNEVVLQTFHDTTGIVYILPEVKTIQQVFSLSTGAGGALGKNSPQIR